MSKSYKTVPCECGGVKHFKAKNCKNCLKNRFKDFDLEKIIKESFSIREVARKLNTSPTKNIQDIIKKSGYDTSHFTVSFPGSSKYLSLAGKKFSKLIINKIYSKHYCGKSMYFAECKCECGNITEALLSHITRGFTQSCGCLRKEKYESGRKNKLWSGVGDISGTQFSRIERNARRRGIHFDLSKEYLWELYIKQNKKCSITGIDIFFGPADETVLTTASLDRIDSNKPYIEGNVQWVFKKINAMKMDLSMEDFISLCKKAVENNGRY